MIVGLLPLLPELRFLQLLLHFVIGCAREGIKENHNNRCQPEAERHQIIRRDQAQQG